jgi:hypothetical protein
MSCLERTYMKLLRLLQASIIMYFYVEIFYWYSIVCFHEFNGKYVNSIMESLIEMNFCINQVWRLFLVGKL